MTSIAILSLAFVLVFFGLILFFATTGRDRPGRRLREIPAFARLRRAVGLAVEAGQRLHLSLGSGEIIGTRSAVALVGLSVLVRIARAASISDRPPIATSGEGVLAVLSQDTLRSTARDVGAEYDPASGRLTGLTPFSYAAGALSLVHEEEVAANILIGSFGSEVALISEAGERSGSLTLAGTDNLPGQSVLYATAQETLIGEEAFAGGAYLGAGPTHIASLRAQDIFRWALIAIILAGAILKFLGVL